VVGLFDTRLGENVGPAVGLFVVGERVVGLDDISEIGEKVGTLEGFTDADSGN